MQHYTTDLYFLVEWLTEKESEQDDSERLVDVLPSKAVEVGEGTDVLDINESDTAHAKFKGKLYPVKIVGKVMLCLCVYKLCVSCFTAIAMLAHLIYRSFNNVQYYGIAICISLAYETINL